MNNKIAVFNVDHNPMMREAMASVINAQPDMCLVAQASTGSQAVKQFREYKADITLVDLRLPDIGGIETIKAIRAEFPEARLIMLSTFEYENEIRRALAAGAQGYMLKSMPPEELIDVIRQVHAGKKKIPAQIAVQLAEHYGEQQLTDREVEVLRHLVDGKRNRDIAERLLIGVETVRTHMKNIMKKLGANDRTQALAIALRRGVIQL